MNMMNEDTISLMIGTEKYVVDMWDLAPRMRIFRTLCKDPTKEKQIYQVQTKVNKETFEEFIEAGKRSIFPEINVVNVFDFWRLSNEFQFKEMIERIEKYLEEEPETEGIIREIMRKNRKGNNGISEVGRGEENEEKEEDNEDDSIFERFISKKFDIIIEKFPKMIENYDIAKIYRILINKETKVTKMRELFDLIKHRIEKEEREEAKEREGDKSHILLECIDCSKLDQESIFQVIEMTEKYQIHSPGLNTRVNNLRDQRFSEIEEKMKNSIDIVLKDIQLLFKGSNSKENLIIKEMKDKQLKQETIIKELKAKISENQKTQNYIREEIKHIQEETKDLRNQNETEKKRGEKRKKEEKNIQKNQKDIMNDIIKQINLIKSEQTKDGAEKNTKIKLFNSNIDIIKDEMKIIKEEIGNIKFNEPKRFEKSEENEGILSYLKKQQRNEFDKYFIASQSSNDIYNLIDPKMRDKFSSSNSGDFWIIFEFKEQMKMNGIVITTAEESFPSSFDILVEDKIVFSIKNMKKLSSKYKKETIIFKESIGKKIKFLQTGPNSDEHDNYLFFKKFEILSSEAIYSNGIFSTMMKKYGPDPHNCPVHISSQCFDLNSIHSLNWKQNTWTFNNQTNWLQIEIKKGIIFVNSFRLKKRINGLLRFKLIGTNDCSQPIEDWTTLFINEEPKPKETKIEIEIKLYTFDILSNDHFKYLRIIQTNNNENDYDYEPLTIGHLDIFGSYLPL